MTFHLFALTVQSQLAAEKRGKRDYRKIYLFAWHARTSRSLSVSLLQPLSRFIIRENKVPLRIWEFPVRNKCEFVSVTAGRDGHRRCSCLPELLRIIFPEKCTSRVEKLARYHTRSHIFPREAPFYAPVDLSGGVCAFTCTLIADSSGSAQTQLT